MPRKAITDSLEIPDELARREARLAIRSRVKNVSALPGSVPPQVWAIATDESGQEGPRFGPRRVESDEIVISRSRLLSRNLESTSMAWAADKDSD